MAKKTLNGSAKLHVISREGSWAVKREGATRASKVYKTKDAAIRGAKKSSSGSDVVIHKRDGSIEKWQKLS